MDLRTAIGIEAKRQEFDKAVEAAQQEAAASEVAATKENTEDAPSARERFQALGEQVLALFDLEGTSKKRSGEERTGKIHVGADGLAIIVKAHLRYTRDDFTPRELDRIEVDWISGDDTHRPPLVTEGVSLAEVCVTDVTPATLGTMSLIEQSLEVAKLARQSANTPAA